MSSAAQKALRWRRRRNETISLSAIEKTGEQNQTINTSKRNPLQNVDVNSPKRSKQLAKQVSVQKPSEIHISPLPLVPAPSSSQERKGSSDESRPISKGKFEVFSVKQNSHSREKKKIVVQDMLKKESNSVKQRGNSYGSPKATWYQEPTEESIKILAEFAKEFLLSGHGQEEVRFVLVWICFHDMS